MKTLRYFIVATILLVVLLAGLTSCGTTNSLHRTNTDTEVAGYTLKNKAELMQQKILNIKKTTVMVTP
ncbi:hypothetical protein ATE92_1453 [Ulvibacter sp. MAR_2010_11]|uniref:hypothetical protein n=1 Tax=Ulvibacter sp. MAR_2010_11 TaxID=1250229 RepID=UPI000CAEF90E|nr:hypothetical protein [Ulvibacter sp. MAR_2010_11]PKA83303.1 hypothetical protein ATE92_1453 [Ulvibacter sp. MAR_2010_11]